jgi:spermidine synthase
MDGPITHGTQFLAINLRRQSTTYYGPRSGVGLVLRQFGHKGNLRVGVIGLGAGTLASYGRRGDHYTFYEINPLVIHLAETAFTFLKDSEAKVDIIPGDARLSLDREPAQGFDVLALDAFSGDSIPVHLLTREAFVLYFRHLKSDGIVAVHVSNMYLDLQPVVQRAAESLGKEAIVVHNDQDADNDILPATWVLVSDRRQVFDEGEVKRAGSLLEQRSDVRVWTDDYSNLFQVLR